MSATTHWTSLDDMMSRLLPRPGMLHARERFARRAAALTDIYMARILKTIGKPATDGIDVTRYAQELQRTHHALTDALARVWTTHQGSSTDYEGRQSKKSTE